MNLREAIDYIKKYYKQELIFLKEYDYLHKDFFEKPNPKFLFRGEQKYPTTKSNYHRAPISELEQKYILDLSIAIIEKYFGLYEKGANYELNMNKVTAIIQHYGFKIMWLDFTEDPKVAAFFASYKNQQGEGVIWITETEDLIKNSVPIYKLEGNYAKRPTLQKAYALRMFDDKPDFQNEKNFNAKKIEFTLSEEDIKHFDNKLLLSTASDYISDFIIDYISVNKIQNQNILNIKKDLEEKKNWC